MNNLQIMKGKLYRAGWMAYIVIILSACQLSCTRQTYTPPNFIIILTDDQGYNDLGCYGSNRVETPRIDQMAKEGIIFTDFYAQNVCGPSRAALMSGCYPIRVGEPGNLKHQHTILHTREITLAEKLKEAGYATACIGKWHLGLQSKEAPAGWDPSTMPNGQGFDYFYGTPLFNGFTVYLDDTPFRSQLLKNGDVLEERIENWDFCTSDYTREAIDWIRQNRERPFFLYLAHNMPHIPLGAGKEFKGRNHGDPYADAIEEIDWSTGKILNYLREEGLDKNTIVFFFSDNGPWIETTHGNDPRGKAFIPPGHSGQADPLRGYKMLSWDGGHRVPCLAWSPGLIPGNKVVEEIVTSMDLYPTFVSLSGASLDAGIKRDGMDITGLLKDPDHYRDSDRIYYYYVYTHLQAIRQGDWKLVLPRPEFPEWTGFAGRFHGNGVEEAELYNLRKDIAEENNVAGQYPEVVSRMMGMVEKARGSLGDYNRTGTEARFFEEPVVQNLKCEFLSNPRGIEQATPRFSWEVDSPGERNVFQASCRILVYESEKVPSKETEPVWDSGKIISGNSVNVRYQGLPLKSAKKYYWKVQVEDHKGKTSLFSDWARFETGILEEKDWISEWIYSPGLDSTNHPFIKKEFFLDSVPEYAPAFVASVGFHELYVNGARIGDAVLTPSVSDLRNRALYTSYDIAPSLKKGRNTMVIWLASGWADFIDRNPQVDLYSGKKPLCKAQFRIDSDQWIGTDQTWKFTRSNTSHLGKWHNSDFGGDEVDDSNRDVAWASTNDDVDLWRNVGIAECWLKISSDFIEPNRTVKKIPAISIIKTGEKKYQVKMDMIYTGWIEAKLKGDPGQRISISASSWPDKEVEFNQKNILQIGSDGEEIFRNRFTYHQVEYMTVEGINYQPEPGDIVGYQVTNDRERHGDFLCSNELLNRIYNATVYTYESLSTGGMTVDCPHRERLGYGGDGHGSLEIALDAFASYPFFSKWAQDWVDIQDDNGRINHTAPTLGGGGGPAWSGFILTMPWDVYLAYGDTGILDKSFPAARRWLEYLEQNENEKGLLGIVSPGDWLYSGGNKWLFLGDWAAPGSSEQSDSEEALLFNNCYYVYVLKVASQIAGILEMEDKKEYFSTKANEVASAVNRTFYDPSNYTYIDTRQTHLVMPLVAGIVPQKDIPQVRRKLEEEILLNQDGHFDTGIHGTYFLTKYLTLTGRHDLLYKLTGQITYPGYGEILSRGEITWPEYWNEVNSRVHGCLNGIGGWFQRGILGIQPDSGSPGYQKFVVNPAILDSLEWAKGYHLSPYGKISVSWVNTGESFQLEVDIPENTSASVFIRASSAKDVTESGVNIADNKDIRLTNFENNFAELQIGSGFYTFHSMLPRKRVKLN